MSLNNNSKRVKLTCLKRQWRRKRLPGRRGRPKLGWRKKSWPRIKSLSLKQRSWRQFQQLQLWIPHWYDCRQAKKIMILHFESKKCNQRCNCFLLLLFCFLFFMFLLLLFFCFYFVFFCFVLFCFVLFFLFTCTKRNADFNFYRIEV